MAFLTWLFCNLYIIDYLTFLRMPSCFLHFKSYFCNRCLISNTLMIHEYIWGLNVLIIHDIRSLHKDVGRSIVFKFAKPLSYTFSVLRDFRKTICFQCLYLFFSLTSFSQMMLINTTYAIKPDIFQIKFCNLVLTWNMF